MYLEFVAAVFQLVSERMQFEGQFTWLSDRYKTGTQLNRQRSCENKTASLGSRNDGALGVMDFNGRRRGLEDARNEMLRAPSQDPLQGRRNSANTMLERAREMEGTNPEGAERLRKRAEQLLSVTSTDGGGGLANNQDPER